MQSRSFWTPIYGHILIALAKHSSIQPFILHFRPCPWSRVQGPATVAVQPVKMHKVCFRHAAASHQTHQQRHRRRHPQPLSTLAILLYPLPEGIVIFATKFDNI